MDSDGSINVEYEVRNAVHGYANVGVLWLLKVALDGSTSTTQLSSSNIGNLWPGQVIPDGQEGILATWAIDPTYPQGIPHPYQGAHVSSGGVTTFDMPMSPQNLMRDPNTFLPLGLPLVLGENGTAFVSYSTNITSFDLNTGAANWNYQAGQTTVSLVSYQNGNGLVAKTTNNGQDTILRFDSTGAATTDSWTASNVDHFQGSSWFGSLSSSSIALGFFQAQQVDPTPSLFPAPNQKRSNRAFTISVKLNFNSDRNHPNKTPGDTLKFSDGQNTCSESLGLIDCTSTSGFWLWNLEGNAHVYNDASNWKTAVSVQYHFRGFYRDDTNHLQPFSCTIPVQPDGPLLTFLQQQPGQKSIFYLDAPGPNFREDPIQQCLSGRNLIDSENFVFNFTVTFTRSYLINARTTRKRQHLRSETVETQPNHHFPPVPVVMVLLLSCHKTIYEISSSKLSGFHKTVYYFVKFIISPGGVLDRVKSNADYGNLPLDF